MISCHFDFMISKITSVIFNPEFPICCIIRCAVGRETEVFGFFMFCHGFRVRIRSPPLVAVTRSHVVIRPRTWCSSRLDSAVGPLFVAL